MFQVGGKQPHPKVGTPDLLKGQHIHRPDANAVSFKSGMSVGKAPRIPGWRKLCFKFQRTENSIASRLSDRRGHEILYFTVLGVVEEYSCLQNAEPRQRAGVRPQRNNGALGLTPCLVWEQNLLVPPFPIITRWGWGGSDLSKCLPRSGVRSVPDGYMNK